MTEIEATPVTEGYGDLIDEIYDASEHRIFGFFHKHHFLSNFYLADIKFDSLTFTTSEAAYQSQKTTNEKTRLLFTEMNPYQAKSFGNKLALRPDWEKIKVGLMLRIVEQKFLQHRELKAKLLDTKNAYLEETNCWNDRFWGCTPDHKGKNYLGFILMAIRSKFYNHINFDAEELSQSTATKLNSTIINAARLGSNSTLFRGGLKPF